MKKNDNNINWHLLAKDVSGELSKAEHEQLQDQLADNPNIEKQMRKLWGDAHYAQALQSIDTNGAWDKVKPQLSSKQPLFRRMTMVSAAAAVIVLLVGTFFFTLYNNRHTMSITTAQATQTITLPDGSKVDLNYGSTLTYPKKFKRTSRIVQLEGEAFFDVTPNPKQPFIIETKQLNIRVLGTSFNVKAYKGANNSEVSVASGTVRVDSRINDDNIILTAGDAVNYSNHSKILTKHKLKSDNYQAWKTQKLEFDNTTLHEVFRTIESSYHITIQLNDGIDADEKLFNGNFSQHSLEHVLQSVCTTFNLEYTKQNKVYYIHRMH
ncbi:MULTISPECIES: FecR family protein [unclassified Carboxylicivirga]|uniref:FecR family protein n=1 Tax=Carboxylicivirga TaxID=1628153 RepID=UPI003D34A1BD